MSRTVKFYNIAIYKNREKTNISILQFLDIVGVLHWSKRLRKIDGYPTAIHTLDFDDNQPFYRVIPFVKYRQNYKPYVGDITSPRNLEEIKSDVIEVVTMLYDENRAAIALEGTLYGLKEKGIEKYLSSFLPSNPDVDYQVLLTPILSNRGLEDITKSSQVRSIELYLSLSNYHESTLFESEGEEKYIMKALRSMGKAKEELDANKLRIDLGVGNGKKSTLDLKSVQFILQKLNIDNDSVEAIKVRYRDEKTGNLETVDLKNSGGPLKDVILKNDSIAYPGWEYVANEMLTSYNQFSGVIRDAYSEFSADMRPISRLETSDFFTEKLILNPPENLKVPLKD
ncbi:hypothetical protein WQ57_02035 [Mesobacillus campisalis]|uniref:Uncharacterized protein n=1 Tax=Mesobacillus campisalis TaxID=1408103 RepID=A0A0M2T2L5_9BACI|nr:DUF6731 family protein [Mesobacillus campisalis]KKK39492.1 hypothetical protein WQ57_02035 [Mesobacillus campisalis]